MKNACFTSIVQEETIVGAHVKMGLTSQLSLTNPCRVKEAEDLKMELQTYKACPWRNRTHQ